MLFDHVLDDGTRKTRIGLGYPVVPTASILERGSALQLLFFLVNLEFYLRKTRRDDISFYLGLFIVKDCAAPDAIYGYEVHIAFHFRCSTQYVRTNHRIPTPAQLAIDFLCHLL